MRGDLPLSVDDQLSLHDVERVRPEDISRVYVVEAYSEVIGVVERLISRTIQPALKTVAELSKKQEAILLVHHRIHALAKTAAVLQAGFAAQSLMAASRSSIELLVDMELLHRDMFPDGVERLETHADYQRLAAARKTLEFYRGRPELRKRGLDRMARFVAESGERIDQATERLWPTSPGRRQRVPQHWSGRDFKDRARLLGEDFHQLVVDGYDMRNWFVHGGITGFGSLDDDSVLVICRQALEAVHTCVMGSTTVVLKAVDLGNVAAQWLEMAGSLASLPGLRVVDLVLQSRGEPSRVHVTERALASTAS